jgi:hypothetical protein
LSGNKNDYHSSNNYSWGRSNTVQIGETVGVAVILVKINENRSVAAMILECLVAMMVAVAVVILK